MATPEVDPEDILSASLQSLYGLSPVTFSAAGAVFSYPIDPKRIAHLGPPSKHPQIVLATPDTDPANWSLHASSIWVSALFLADHLEELHIDTFPPGLAVTILELGAGAGLPSILLAQLYPNTRVAASDYPDDRLIRTLTDNIARNGVAPRCHAVPYAWGTDVGPVFRAHASASDAGASPTDSDGRCGFDVVVAADTLWNPGLHVPFLETLGGCLRRTAGARVYLVAGLHTGRYTIQSFLDRVSQWGLMLVSATEREMSGTQSRPWDVSRAEGEDERERRRWVVWMILKWGGLSDATRDA